MEGINRAARSAGDYERRAALRFNIIAKLGEFFERRGQTVVGRAVYAVGAAGFLHVLRIDEFNRSVFAFVSYRFGCVRFCKIKSFLFEVVNVVSQTVTPFVLRKSVIMALSVRAFVAEHSLFSVCVDCKLLIVFDIAYDFIKLHKFIRCRISVHIRFCFIEIDIVTVRTEAVVRNKFIVLNRYVYAFLAAFVRFVFLKFRKSCRRVLNPFYCSVSSCRSRENENVYAGFGR